MTANSSDYGRLFFQAEVFRAGRLGERRARPAGAIIEPARRVPLFRDCDVLVAGGGPAGTAAYWKERTAAFHGIVTWSPTIDPELLKLLSQ